MKPEIRVKLLKEYEKIKTKAEPGSIWGNIIALIIPVVFFVRTVTTGAGNPTKDNYWLLVLLSVVLILTAIWQSIIIVRKIYDKKFILLLQAVLDLSEDKKYDEIKKLDLEIEEKTNDTIKN